MTRPLDARQQALVLSCLPLARGLANRLARRWGRHRDSIEAEEAHDTALAALVYVAGAFDPSRGMKFPPYAAIYIRWQLCRLLARWARRRRVGQLSAVGAEGDGCESEDFAPPDERMPTPDGAAELAELLARVRSVLPDRLWYVAWECFAAGRLHTDLAAEMGVSKEWVRQLALEAVREARYRLPRLVEGQPVKPHQCRAAPALKIVREGGAA